jgi:hypothetical protein
MLYFWTLHKKRIFQNFISISCCLQLYSCNKLQNCTYMNNNYVYVNEWDKIYRLCQWYISIAITIVDIIHRTVFYSKYNISETGFFPCLQVGPTQMDTIERASLSPDHPPEYVPPENGDIIQSPKCCALIKKKRTIDSVQNCDSYLQVDCFFN